MPPLRRRRRTCIALTRARHLTFRSKRGFQKRFKEWGFPAKHVRQPNDAALFDRTRQLWEVNTAHKQMVAILNAEGFEVTERQLSKIRHQHGLWIRDNRKRQHVESELDDGEGEHEGETPAGEKRPRNADEDSGVPAEVIAKRRERHARLMEESEGRLKSRTRRRRTRGWAGLPADEATEPRFPSELTLAEAIEDLDLDRGRYREVRRAFEDICHTTNLVKKTICGPERWAEAKDILISRFTELQAIFWGPDAPYLNQTRKPMALDVVCMDVTKRLRTAGNYMTIAEAKNTLGLTPQEAREARDEFDTILKADFFTGKLESTKEHWEELKSNWVKGNTRLRMAMALGDQDAAFDSKSRAIEAIARDVQKRNRDKQTRQVFPRESDTAEKPAQPTTDARVKKPAKPLRATTTKTNDKAMPRGQKYDSARKAGMDLLSQVNTLDIDGPETPNPIATLASQALASAPSQTANRDYSGMQIDPSLLQAASLPNNSLSDLDQDLFSQMQQAVLPEPTQKSVYFRLSPNSVQRFPSASKIWLDTLSVEDADLESLRTLALRGSGLVGVGIQTVEGLAPRESGEKWAIDEDDELEAYLAMVGNGKATFVLEVVQAS